MRARDGRSVGELLLDCDLKVREVLMDTPLMDGRVMVRTWGEVVEAAGDLWRALPDPSAGTAGSARRDAGAALMAQLEAMNGSLLKAARKRQWPGTGPADERLLQVCENLTLAAELLPRRRTDIRPMRKQVRADLEAATARLMHVLYVGAHGVQVALNRDLRLLAVMPAARRATLPAESMKRTVEARDRMACFEQLVASYVSATFPAALHGEHKPLPEPDRLRQALATWDIQAHRALARTTTAATIMLVAQTQAHTAYATQTLLRAASETRAIEPRQYRDRLAPALEAAQASWVALATTWAQLAPARGRRLRPDLVVAANEIRAALLELTHDHTGPATVETLAATVDLKHAAQTLQLGLATSTDLAYALREATTNPDLLASAREVNAIAMALEALGPHGNVSPEAWVRLADHAHDRPVALPDTIRDSLTRAAEHTAYATTTAAGAAAALSAPDRDQAANPHHAELDSPVHRGRQPPGLPAPSPSSVRLR
ncbi:hypothetical protein [Humibacillus xanthopallidus]|uniref:hypothetical protein n=1 Tax=Humibacillus xanthopallidus TaxID=412689 RepID=UPI00384C969F